MITLLAMLLLSGTAVVQMSNPRPNIEDKAVKRVPPVYPPLAKRNRVQGKVVVGLEVCSEGTVTNMEFLEGNALFRPVSMEAAKQWVFQKSSSGMNGHIVFIFQLKEQ
jgi:TonB family protein